MHLTLGIRVLAAGILAVHCHADPCAAQPLEQHALAAARAAFPAPDAEWSVVTQTFWPNHMVLKLERVPDPRWYHRPTVAVDAHGVASVLTEGALRLPQAKIIERFNAIALAEGVSLAVDDLSAYAGFFLRTHLLNGDEECLRAALPRPTTPRPPFCGGQESFRLSTRGLDAVNIDTVLLHRTRGLLRAQRFLLRTNGTVTCEW